MPKKDCTHPNCRLAATSPHPRRMNGDKELCDAHFKEIASVLEKSPPSVVLTYQDNK